MITDRTLGILILTAIGILVCVLAYFGIKGDQSE